MSDLECGRSESEFLRSVEEKAFFILSELGAPPPRRIQQGNRRAVLSQLERLGSYVDKVLDTRLDFYIEVRNLFLINYYTQYYCYSCSGYSVIIRIAFCQQISAVFPLEVVEELRTVRPHSTMFFAE